VESTGLAEYLRGVGFATGIPPHYLVLDLVHDFLHSSAALGDRALVLGERLDDGSEFFLGHLGKPRQSLLTDDLFNPPALNVGVSGDRSIGRSRWRTLLSRPVGREDLWQTVEQAFVAPAAATFDLRGEDVYASLAESSFERQFELSFMALSARGPQLIHGLLFDPGEEAWILELLDEATLVWHGSES
jgi:hypothetical protein